jgi:cytochrome c oxidase assembly protein subunit 15
MVLIQFGLGVATIVSGVQLWIGVAHQAGAALLLIAVVGTAHRLGRNG